MPIYSIKKEALKGDVDLTLEEPTPVTEENVSRWESTKAGFKKENLFAIMTEYENEHFDPDHNYNVFSDEKWDEHPPHWYEEAFGENIQSHREYEQFVRNMKKSDELNKVANENPGYGIVGRVLGGVADPTVLIGGGIGAVAKAGRVAKAVRAATVAGSAESGLEIVKHQYDPGRTTEESVWNVSGVAVLSGVLGGLIGGKGKALYDEIPDKPHVIQKTETHINTDPGDLSVGAAEATVKGTQDQLTIAGGPIIEALSKLLPFGRAMTKSSTKMRQAWVDGTDLPVLTKGHIDGTLAIPESAESMMRRISTVAKTHVDDEVRAAVKELTERLVREGGPRVSKNQAEEMILKYSRVGDEGFPDAMLEVKQAGKKLRDLRQTMVDELIESGKYSFNKWAKQFPGATEDDFRKYIQNVAARDWDTMKIKKNHQTFQREVIEPAVRRNNPDFDDVEVQELVENVYHHIASSRDATRIAPDKATVEMMQKGGLDISDTAAEKWMIPNLRDDSFSFIDRMSRSISMYKKFDAPDLTDVKKEVDDDYIRLMRGAPQGSARYMELDAERMKAQNLLKYMEDKLLGRMDTPLSKDHKMIQGMRMMKQLQTMSKMGQFMLSSIPDLGRVIFAHGLKAPFKALFKNKLFLSTASKVARRDMRKLAIGSEAIAQNRIHAGFNLFDPYTPGSKAEHLMNRMSEGFQKASFMSGWNNTMKQFEAIVTDMQIAEILEQGTKAAKRDVAWLRFLGIDETMGNRILAEMKKHGGKVDGTTISNFKDFDPAVRQVYAQALYRQMNDVIITPGIGGQFEWMNKPLFSLIAQFKSFMQESYPRMFIRGMQQGLLLKDIHALEGIMTIGLLGGVSIMAKDFFAGRDFNERMDDPGEFIYDVVDKSGLLALPIEIDLTLDRLSGNSMGIRSMITDEAGRKFYTPSMVASLMGPSAGTIEDIITLARHIAQGEPRPSDVNKIRNIMPYQNLFYTRFLFDAVQEEAREAVE